MDSLNTGQVCADLSSTLLASSLLFLCSLCRCLVGLRSLCAGRWPLCRSKGSSGPLQRQRRHTGQPWWEGRGPGTPEYVSGRRRDRSLGCPVNTSAHKQCSAAPGLVPKPLLTFGDLRAQSTLLGRASEAAWGQAGLEGAVLWVFGETLLS